MENRRESNIELLRIIAMILIVAHHFSIHGGFEFTTDSISVNRLWIQFIQMGGKIGVNLFVLISGYFLVKLSDMKLSKVVRLGAQLFFYSIVIYGIFVGVGLIDFNIKMFIKYLFPPIFDIWWFASTYFVLYLVFPFINVLLNSLSKKMYQKMLILMTLCWCIVPTFTAQSFGSNTLVWFVYLYCLAGYIRLWKDGAVIKNKVIWGAVVILVALTFLSAIIFDIMGFKYPVFSEYATYFYDMQRLPMVLISVALFIGFKNAKVRYSRLINIISTATFGVYLIHDNEFVRVFLWKVVFRNAEFADSVYLIPYSIMVILAVYICCTAVELIRINLFEKQYMKLVYAVEQKKLKSNVNRL